MVKRSVEEIDGHKVVVSQGKVGSVVITQSSYELFNLDDGRTWADYLIEVENSNDH